MVRLFGFESVEKRRKKETELKIFLINSKTIIGTKQTGKLESNSKANLTTVKLKFLYFLGL